jgi:hypothetical protein
MGWWFPGFGDGAVTCLLQIVVDGHRVDEWPATTDLGYSSQRMSELNGILDGTIALKAWKKVSTIPVTFSYEGSP